MHSQGSFLAVALVSITLGVAAFWFADASLSDPSTFVQAQSPLFFPALIGLGLLINGFVMLVQALRIRGADVLPPKAREDANHALGQSDPAHVNEPTAGRTWSGVLALLVYWLSMPWFGFWASSALVMVSLALLFDMNDVNDPGRAVRGVAIATIVKIVLLALVFPYVVIELFWRAGHIILPQAAVLQ